MIKINDYRDLKQITEIGYQWENCCNLPEISEIGYDKKELKNEQID